jgi:hypothetical protein
LRGAVCGPFGYAFVAFLSFLVSVFVGWWGCHHISHDTVADTTFKHFIGLFPGIDKSSSNKFLSGYQEEKKAYCPLGEQ